MASTTLWKLSRLSRRVENPFLRSRGQEEIAGTTEWHGSLTAVGMLTEDGVLEDLHQYIIFCRLGLIHSKGSSCEGEQELRHPNSTD